MEKRYLRNRHHCHDADALSSLCLTQLSTAMKRMGNIYGLGQLTATSIGESNEKPLRCNLEYAERCTSSVDQVNEDSVAMTSVIINTLFSDDAHIMIGMYLKKNERHAKYGQATRLYSLNMHAVQIRRVSAFLVVDLINFTLRWPSPLLCRTLPRVHRKRQLSLSYRCRFAAEKTTTEQFRLSAR